MTPISKRNQYLDSFLANIRLEKGLSSNTIKAYEIDCSAFINWVEKEFDLDILNIKESHIRKYITYFHNRNLSNSTINRKLSALKHFFLFLNKKCPCHHPNQ